MVRVCRAGDGDIGDIWRAASPDWSVLTSTSPPTWTQRICYKIPVFRSVHSVGATPPIIPSSAWTLDPRA